MQMANIQTLEQLLAHLMAGEPDGPARTLRIPGQEALVAHLLRKYPRAFREPADDYDPTLTVITFNLAYNAQINFASGTEKKFVEACQRQPGGNGIIKETGFSVCSTRALQWIKDQRADLVGLQEVNTSLVPDLRRFFQGDLKLSIYESVGFLYRESTMGLPTVLSKGGTIGQGSFRYFYVLWFPRPRTLAVVLHADHGINLKNEIEIKVNGALEPHIESIRPQRILCMGDFNDAGGKLSELKLLGLTLRQHRWREPFLTCCYDKFLYRGDYIFDTRYREEAFYYAGDLKPQAAEPLMSDHRPVTLRDINIFS